MIANMLNQTPGIDIPQYTQQYKSEPYPPPDDAVIVENKPIKTSKKCFNCGGKNVLVIVVLPCHVPYKCEPARISMYHRNDLQVY